MPAPAPFLGKNGLQWTTRLDSIAADGTTLRADQLTDIRGAQNAYQRRMEAKRHAELDVQDSAPKVSADISRAPHLLVQLDELQFMKSSVPFGASKLGVDTDAGPSSPDSKIEPHLLFTSKGVHRLPQRSDDKPPSPEWKDEPFVPLTIPSVSDNGPGLAQTSQSENFDSFPIETAPCKTQARTHLLAMTLWQ